MLSGKMQSVIDRYDPRIQSLVVRFAIIIVKVHMSDAIRERSEHRFFAEIRFRIVTDIPGKMKVIENTQLIQRFPNKWQMKITGVFNAQFHATSFGVLF